MKINLLMLQQLFLFGIVGVVGFLVDSGVLYLTKSFLGLYIGRMFSFVSAVLTTWLLNRIITFKKNTNTSLIREFMLYLGCMFFGGLVNLGTYYLLINNSSFILDNPIIGIAIGSVAGMLINFISSKWLVFK